MSKKLIQLKNINGDSLDPVNLNYENRLYTLENKKENYSSTEFKTNKVYIDSNNKQWPIYRKTLIITSQDTQHGISNMGRIISESAIVKRNNYYGYADMSHYVVIQSNKIWLINDALDYASYGITLTIEYTKTTD